MATIIAPIDALILKAADILEQRGAIPFTLVEHWETKKGKVCLAGALFCAYTGDPTYCGEYDSLANKAIRKIGKVVGTDTAHNYSNDAVTWFNNGISTRTLDAHMVAETMRTIAKNQPV